MADDRCSILLVADFGAALVTVDVARHPAARAAAEALLGHDGLPPAGRVGRGDGPACLWQGPRDWLLTGSVERVADLADDLRVALAPWPALVSVQSDALIAFDLAGPRAADVLATGTGVDLHPSAFPIGASVVTRFGPLRATLFRHAQGYRLIVDRSRGAWLHLWLEKAVAGLPPEPFLPR